MNKAIFITSLLVIASVAAPVAKAAESTQCQPIYGGGDSCVKTPQVEINKTVQNPQNQVYVDNLGVGDAKFAPTQIVSFKITVKNTSEIKLTNVVIKDVLPNIVDFSGGVGDFDAKTKTLTIKVESLAAGEVRDFYVQAKVVTKDKLPADQGVSCVVNQAIITAADKTAQDNSQFCIEKSMTPPTNNPGLPEQPKGGQPVVPGNNLPTTKGGQPVVPGTNIPVTNNAGTTTTNPTTTKGGLPVYPPTKATTTPSTGPESIALIGLIPSAIGGVLLRRKSK
ncbi:MAG TPA: hypothetical protein VNA13_03750 [Xanthomonadales bacterium]|nr:hypothetical protein [Xanthomonadales bacterium]